MGVDYYAQLYFGAKIKKSALRLVERIACIWTGRCIHFPSFHDILTKRPELNVEREIEICPVFDDLHVYCKKCGTKAEVQCFDVGVLHKEIRIDNGELMEECHLVTHEQAENLLFMYAFSKINLIDCCTDQECITKKLNEQNKHKDCQCDYANEHTVDSATAILKANAEAFDCHGQLDLIDCAEDIHFCIGEAWFNVYPQDEHVYISTFKCQTQHGQDDLVIVPETCHMDQLQTLNDFLKRIKCKIIQQGIICTLHVSC